MFQLNSLSYISIGLAIVIIVILIIDRIVGKFSTHLKAKKNKDKDKRVVIKLQISREYVCEFLERYDKFVVSKNNSFKLRRSLWFFIRKVFNETFKDKQLNLAFEKECRNEESYQGTIDTSNALNPFVKFTSLSKKEMDHLMSGYFNDVDQIPEESIVKIELNSDKEPTLELQYEIGIFN